MARYLYSHSTPGTTIKVFFVLLGIFVIHFEKRRKKHSDTTVKMIGWLDVFVRVIHWKRNRRQTMRHMCLSFIFAFNEKKQASCDTESVPERENRLKSKTFKCEIPLYSHTNRQQRQQESQQIVNIYRIYSKKKIVSK